MRRSKITPEKQFQLITECRQSGLSDYRWCKENDINPGTFYNWVARLRKKGCALPTPVDPDSLLTTEHQDVVKVDLISDVQMQDSIATYTSEPVTPTVPHAVMQLQIAGSTLIIANDTDPVLLSHVIRALQGGLC